MAYDGVRSYLGTSSLAAQNVVMTASGAIAPGTAVATHFSAEPTFICSIAGYVTAAASSFPAGVRYYVVVGTSTSTGLATPSPAGFVLQTASTASLSTFVPPVAVGGATVFTVGLVSTGTASATQTLSAIQTVIGVAPQYV